MNSLADFLTKQESKFPQKPFIIFKDKQISYHDFLMKVNRIGNGLKKLGIKPGDKVALLGSNSIEWLLAHFSIVSIGAVTVPINPALAPEEKIHQIVHPEVSSLFIDDGAIPAFEEIYKKVTLSHIIVMGEAKLGDSIKMSRLMEEDSVPCKVERKPDDPCMVFHTGGTTALPKTAMIPHRVLHWLMSEGPKAWKVSPDDRFSISGALAFAMGTMNILPICFGIGGTIVLVERFHPKVVCEAIQRNKVTIFTGVPTMFAMLLSFDEISLYDLSSLKKCFSAGGPLPPEVVKRFYQKFGIMIHDYYGLTEAVASTVVDSSFSPERIFKKPGSAGSAVTGIQLRIVDNKNNDLPVGEVGEILIKGDNLLREYYKRPDATKEALREGWFYTGDLGRLDKDGELYIVDRKKDLIIRGGANIFPREIEEVLYTHPKIGEAAVVGVPDEVFGEQVKAYIVLSPGESATEEEVKQYCTSRIAEYKVPRYVEFVKSLPKSKATEKILKRELRKG